MAITQRDDPVLRLTSLIMIYRLLMVILVCSFDNNPTRGWIVIQKASQFTLQVFHNLNLGTCEA
jgi:hypothetical protein